MFMLSSKSVGMTKRLPTLQKAMRSWEKHLKLPSLMIDLQTKPQERGFALVWLDKSKVLASYAEIV